MDKNSFFIEFSKKASEIQIELSNKQINQFYKYMQLLLEWNKKMNLTAIEEPKEIILKHFIDSLTIRKYVEENEKILDIGTGAGFPGIPLKIVEGEKEVVLIDSLNKRISFLKEVISNLELNKIEVIHGRAEEVVKQNNRREKYNIVTSRAVARLNVLIEYMLPFIAIGGKCICMKSTDIEEEVQEARKAINILGGEIEKIDTFILPESDIKRKIVVIKKVKSTPSKYPRKAGTPSKDPIK